MTALFLLDEYSRPSALPGPASGTIVEFVRALAIRQARLDALQPIEAANDNQRRTIH